VTCDNPTQVTIYGCRICAGVADVDAAVVWVPGLADDQVAGQFADVQPGASELGPDLPHERVPGPQGRKRLARAGLTSWLVHRRSPPWA
jgi:hypothetical protein